jgi:hypothetical protein
MLVNSQVVGFQHVHFSFSKVSLLVFLSFKKNLIVLLTLVTRETINI